MASYWLQLDLDLLDSPRWMGIGPWSRHLYIAMLKRCIQTMCGDLVRAEWTDRVAYSLIGATAADQPPSCAAMLEELAGPACHLIDISETTITVHGFDRRYRTMFERAERARELGAERQRRRRDRERGCNDKVTDNVTQLSRVTDDDVTRDAKTVTQPVTREKRDVTAVDLDVDVDVIPRGINSPPLTLDVSVTGLARDNGNGTAGKAHIAPEQTATAPATAKGNGTSEGKPPSKPVDLPRYDGTPDDPRPWIEVTSDTRKRFAVWAARDGGKFRMVAQLQRMMRQADADDPVRLLAHVLEVDAMEAAESAMAVLYERLRPRKEGEDWLIPAEERISEAKVIVNRDAEKRGGHPQLAAAIVQAAIEGSKREDPPDDDPGPGRGGGGGGLKSPAAKLQEKLEAKRARDAPAKPTIEDLSASVVTGAVEATTGENRLQPQEPPEPIVTRAQRRRARRRTAEDADLAEVPAPIAALFEGLTAGWSGPNDTNHAAEKRVVHTLLAGNAIRALAYADVVNRTAIVRGEDPWIVMAGMCRDLPEEALPSREMAIRLIRDAPRCTGDTS